MSQRMQTTLGGSHAPILQGEKQDPERLSDTSKVTLLERGGAWV